MNEETFGRRLKALRERRGLTQEQLAVMTNKHVQQISTWERDAASPRVQSLIQLASALCVEPGELISGEVAKKPRDRPAKPASKPARQKPARQKPVPTKGKPQRRAARK